MVMTFLGQKKYDGVDDQHHEHKVEIEETSEGAEIEVISTAKWASLDQCGNIVEPSDTRSTLSGRSMKSLMDDIATSSDEDSELEEMERSLSSPSRAYDFGKAGWSALAQIDTFLNNMEQGTSAIPPQPIAEEEEEGEALVDENSSTPSSKLTDLPNETMSMSSSEGFDQDKQVDNNTKSRVAEDSKDYQKANSRKKRIRCFLLLLLFLVLVVVATFFALKSANDKSAGMSTESNATLPQPVDDSTTSFQPPAEDTTTNNTPNQPDVLNDPIDLNDDDDYTNPLIRVDPSSLDPSTKNSLLGTLQSFYRRNGLDSSPLDASSGDDTPQRKALFWLASQANEQQDYDQSTQVTRYALAVFYYSTNAVPNHFASDPDSWQIVDGWLTSASHCSWYGIICNLDGDVEEIEMPTNMLTGSLPMELGLLEETLYAIDITDNSIFMFESDYDVFLNLVNLEILSANSNYLESVDGLPLQMASLVNMEMLELSFNILGGDLSSNTVLTSMPQLTFLEMEFNHFTGSIPYYFGNMGNLVYMYMRDNKLTGDLSFLNAGGMTSLFTMWLERNQITGEIPASIASLKELRSLALSDNRLSGRIDALGSLPDLQRIWIHTNQFFGAIPKTLENLQELEILELHNNNLFGKMPKGICDTFAGVTFGGKTLTSDCNGNVECKPGCCTACY